jgi:chorismate mutase
MPVRGVRGAITTRGNQSQLILNATRELLSAMSEANPGLLSEDLASAWFTLTHDLDAAYPAEAARQLGWAEVPMLCAKEIPVPDSLPGCIRVLLHWNTDLPQSAIKHVYMGDAARLRPDLSRKTETAKRKKHHDDHYAQ